VLRNWELDPEHYTADILLEMKLLLRVLSRKQFEEEQPEEEDEKKEAPNEKDDQAEIALPKLRYGPDLMQTQCKIADTPITAS
jgi:hypothetical protein